MCGSVDHLANACPKRRKEMISKAVGYLLDSTASAEESTAKIDVPTTLSAVVMPTYAAQSVVKADSKEEKSAAAVNFASALI